MGDTAQKGLEQYVEIMDSVPRFCEICVQRPADWFCICKDQETFLCCECLFAQPQPEPLHLALSHLNHYKYHRTVDYTEAYVQVREVAEMDRAITECRLLWRNS